MSKINLNIDVAKKLYDKLPYWKKSKENILKYFKRNKEENTEEVILLKVLLIDGLYSTNLKTIKEGNGILKITELIKELYDKKNLLNLILSGKKEALEVIDKESKKSENIKRSIFSFATKYCHFHNQEKFPIYDQYVLAALKDENFRSHIEKINPKENFYAVMDELRNKADLENFEDLDTFLWLYGMKLKYEKGNKKGEENTKINKEVITIFEDNPDILLDLQIK